MNKLFLKSISVLATTFFLTACGGDGSSKAQPKTVFDTLEDDSSYSILVQALETAELDSVLDDRSGTYTVFAPNNQAFTELLADMGISAETLLANPDLANILLYHVVVGSEIDSAAALNAVGSRVMTGSGSEFVVSQSGNDLYINLSRVIDTDMMADNGVIHSVNSVLMPPVSSEPTLNIVETALADDRFETLVTALTAADLVDALSDPNAAYTVFAPTDDAFAALGAGTINALLNDIPALSNILLKHVVDAEADLLTALTLNGTSLETLSGATVPVELVDGSLTVGGASVIISDLHTTNGIIHVIDTVIASADDLPELSIVDVANNAGSFTTLLAALDTAGLTETVADLDSTFTVFAPTDAAFEVLLSQLNIEASDLLALPNLADILLYHVLAGEVDSTAAVAAAGTTIASASGELLAVSLNGEVLNINTAAVQTPDVMAANGVIHIVDSVIMPQAQTVVDDTIAGLVVSDERFSVLESAVVTAGLAGALSDTDATYTVFAPTDDAFTALLGALGLTAEELLASDILLPTLQLHVINGLAVDAVSAYSLSSTYVETLGGEEIMIEITGNQLTVGGAVVSTTDIVTENGIVHVIDSVITM